MLFRSLQAGGKAPSSFVPKTIATNQNSQKLVEQFERKHAKFVHKIMKISEKQADLCLLPHPLLGKITYREMLYFTLYHIGHHHHSIIERQP